MSSLDPSSADVFRRVQTWIEAHYPWRCKIRKPMLRCLLRAEKIWQKVLKKHEHGV